MKSPKLTTNFTLNLQGVDDASATIQKWLRSIGLPRKDIVRIRLTMEEVLTAVCDHEEARAQAAGAQANANTPQADLLLRKWFGEWRLYVRYNGDPFNPVTPGAAGKTDADTWTATLLARTGFIPSYRRRAGKNEILLRIPSRRSRPELMMLGCIGAAIITGILGQWIPAGFKDVVTNYVLSFLSDGFLHLLGTFIGLMIFLSIVTGICGIGSASSFHKIGKLMMSRFIGSTFLTCAVMVIAARIFFPLGAGGAGSGFEVRSILEMIFGILPSNPVQPFLEGNTLQIVFLATIVGLVLLLTGSDTQNLRTLCQQAQILITKCVSGVCMLLPIYIFSSLVALFWKNGTGVILRLWKPLLVGALVCVLVTAVYLVIVCRKLRVKPSVLVPKLLPDFLIALSTSSSAAAFSTSMEINEKKLGIDPSFSRTAVPIGGILFAGMATPLYVLTGAFLAEHYQIQADISWWIILWLMCSLLALATPPVAGGMVSCLSILILQLNIPPEGLVLGTTLALLLDFVGTAFRVPSLHFEVLLQADKLNLLDREILCQEDASR